MDKNQNKSLYQAYSTIVDFLQRQTNDPTSLENFAGTPERCVRALMSMAKSDLEIYQGVNLLLQKTFPVKRSRNTGGGGIVTVGPIKANSMCPHHLLPVIYTAYVSYMPSSDKKTKVGQVIGLSKIPRIVKLLARRPILQEQLAVEIARVINYGNEKDPKSFKCSGVGVQLVGFHSCMSCRGVESDSLSVITELSGTFWEPGIEDKFLAQIQALSITSRP